MPADYSSIAKALAVPISPINSPSLPEREAARPAWSNRLSASRRTSSNPYSLSSSQRPHSYKSQILRSAAKVQRKVIKTFLGLPLWQRFAAVLILVIVNVFFVLFLIYNEKIFGWLAPYAEKWRESTGGWMILWAITFICSFPPMIGYSTAVTISGFVYGFPNGWFIVGSATILGSLASFIACRTVLSKYVHNLIGKDKRFEALALTLKHDGIKILIMIRLCPLPYSLGNAALSTFPTVHPLSFALATTIASPKLLVHVFIGSRLASIAENGGKMDAGTKAVNYASIIIGSILGAAVGWIIYQRTMARAKELEIEELEAGTAEGLVGGRERSYSDLDGEVDLDAAALMNDDDISLWDNDAREGGYRDEFTDDEDVFASGDLDEGPSKTNVKGNGNWKGTS
ncbi:Tlg2-vesicle protein [Mollisiaceae sp. DMI_Dod_QoI]|nr:Tlg2-vesicle protein [Helotiales sp. DMI_Dod_QoI]